VIYSVRTFLEVVAENEVGSDLKLLTFTDYPAQSL